MRFQRYFVPYPAEPQWRQSIQVHALDERVLAAQEQGDLSLHDLLQRVQGRRGERFDQLVQHRECGSKTQVQTRHYGHEYDDGPGGPGGRL